MSDSAVIYDSSKNIEYYRKFLRHQFRLSLILYLIAGGLLFIIGMFGIISPATKHSWVSKTEVFIAIWAGIFFSLFPILYYVDYKNMLKERKVGVRINEKGILFLPRNKHWSYEEIEFVLIDELYHPLGGEILVKTRNYKHVDITPELLKNPQKLWKKFAPKELRANTFNIKWVDNIEEFISTLKHYGVKVYYRKRDSYVIEEVN